MLSMLDTPLTTPLGAAVGAHQCRDGVVRTAEGMPEQPEVVGMLQLSRDNGETWYDIGEVTTRLFPDRKQLGVMHDWVDGKKMRIMPIAKDAD